MNKFQSLHSHTTNSDGQFDHKTLLEKAKNYNLSTIAFTDHDSILSQDQVDSIKDMNDINWISGIEISSGFPLDLGGGPSAMFHIVGLFVNYYYQPLTEYCQNARNGRVERMQKITSNLNSLGFSITEEDCTRESGGEAVARPHIVKALLNNQDNLQRLNGLKEKLKVDAENDLALKDKYELLTKSSIDRWPYILFLTEDSYIKDVYVNNLYYLDMDSVVKLIRDSGGIALLAHYFTCSDKLDEKYLEKIIQEKRIDGLEAVFGLQAFNTSEEKQIIDLMSVADRVSSKFNCIKGGGVDIHTEDHLIKFSNTPTYNLKTINLLDNILNNNNINLEFSNIA